MIVNSRTHKGKRKRISFLAFAFKQLAELVANYLAKGKLASVDGRMQVRTYNDKDGQKRWVTEIVAEDVHFLSPKDNGGTESRSGGKASFGHEVNLDDDIPF